MVLAGRRLTLRNWREADREAFAEMHGNPEVMWDSGGALDRAQSDMKFDRYKRAFEQHGFTRWAVKHRNGDFLGYTGLIPSRPDHPLGPHVDIGWRLVRSAWGQGYAIEAAILALQDGFSRIGVCEVLAYTAPDNLRSQAVIKRLRLQRDAARDFRVSSGSEFWCGLVWFARADWLTEAALRTDIV